MINTKREKTVRCLLKGEEVGDKRNGKFSGIL